MNCDARILRNLKEPCSTVGPARKTQFENTNSRAASATGKMLKKLRCPLVLGHFWAIGWEVWRRLATRRHVVPASTSSLSLLIGWFPTNCGEDVFRLGWLAFMCNLITGIVMSQLILVDVSPLILNEYQHGNRILLLI